MNKKENMWELIKFLITGIAAAAVDALTVFLCHQLFAFLPDLASEAISIFLGFLVSVILNYILSTYWVFKGKQDESVTKSKRFVILFVIFSAIAFGLSFGTYWLCKVIFESTMGVNITEVQINYILKFTFWGDLVFWMFAVAFVLKTLIGLIWNYFSRKYILYKRKPEQVQE